MKFHGDIDQLKALVASTGLPGRWTEEASGKWCFRGRFGQVLNWWPSKGTIQLQGKNLGLLQEAVVGIENDPITGANPSPNTKIFIVHGHDREARDQLELVLMRLGLQPFILQNQDGGSKTIIEALESNIYRDSAFGIVLLTPDDFGYPKGRDEDKQPRARQNVILEMGMVMAALSREKMAILKKGALEIPSDADGIIRLEFNDRVQEVVPKLVQRLQAAGIAVDASKIAAASA